MAVEYRVGDVRDRLAEIPDGSVDLVTCSPPFLALRSYLPADSASKHAEIGSEPTPAAFLSTLLGLSEEWRRILAPHGSIAIELGDTFSGSGGAGGDYGPVGLRSGQPEFDGSAQRTKSNRPGQYGTNTGPPRRTVTSAWPLAKSLCGIPTLYSWSLAYGRNLLDPAHEVSPWRVRNVIVWARPNPAVGALGDKFRPATSYITVACVSDKRWFDLDAVRVDKPQPFHRDNCGGHKREGISGRADQCMNPVGADGGRVQQNAAGAPPLDHWTDDPTDPDDGDLTWKLSAEGSSLAHYAMWPSTLAARLIDSMCPRQVCTVCGEPRRRVTEKTPEYAAARSAVGDFKAGRDRNGGLNGTTQYVNGEHMTAAAYVTTGWSDCGHDSWRNGIVLDPFAGTGTTLAAADFLGRDAIGIDLDPRNADLYPRRRDEVRRKLNPTAPKVLDGQLDLLGGVA